MVETIHKKEESQEEKGRKQNLLFKMPKNVKQIGKTGKEPEIYIEDYVESYLKRLSECDYTECRAAVLIGEVIQTEEKRVLFIRGAVEAEGAVKENELHFTQEIWNAVYEQIKAWFPTGEVVGWFLGGPGFLLEAEEMLLRTHTDQFAGRDKVFYKVDSIEKEAGFYLYENGRLCARSGFFIYYEKNEEMQNYILSRKATHGSEDGFEEPTVKELRHVLQKKQEEKQRLQNEKEKPLLLRAASGTKDSKELVRLFNTAGTLAAFVILIVGAAVLRNFEQVNRMEETLNTMPQPSATQEAATPSPLAAVDSILSYLEQQGITLNGTTAEPTQKAAEDDKSGEEINGEGAKETDSEESKADTEEKEADTSLDEDGTAEPTKLPGAAEEALSDNGITTGENIRRYVVQSGDTLAGICYRVYGDINRMEEIKTLNQIPNENKIYIGQELLLPE